MVTNLAKSPHGFKTDRTYTVGLFLMLAAAVVSAFLIAFNSDFTKSFPYFFLLPWIFLLALVLLTPSLVLYQQGKFSFANPLVFAVWSYFFPAFVLGGIVLSAGWSQPYFLNYIQDAETNLPQTLILIMLGYTGLAVGYFLPAGVALGKFFGKYFSVSEDESILAYVVPGLILLGLGMLNSVVAFTIGVIGYRTGREITSYDGLVYLSTLFWLEATFLLWFVVFLWRRYLALKYVVIGVLLASSLLKAVFAGNRGSLLQSLTVVILAFVLAGRVLTFKRGLLAVVLFFLCVMVGMIYGTTFRMIRESESNSGVDTYAENVVETIDKTGNSGGLDAIQFGLSSLAERLDTVSSLAVVVSNYEQLAPYEESYGLDDNIRKDFVTMLIPRIIWNNKPVASDAQKYGDLYFNYGGNSFAMTPIGDLLRNFGLVGVPLGMLLIGILLRTIYAALVEDRPHSILRRTLYFMLLLSVSYEGFYGLIFPYFLKIGIASVVGILIVSFLAKRLRRSPLTA